MARGRSSNPNGGQFAKGGGREEAGTKEQIAAKKKIAKYMKIAQDSAMKFAAGGPEAGKAYKKMIKARELADKYRGSKTDDSELTGSMEAGARSGQETRNQEARDRAEQERETPKREADAGTAELDAKMQGEISKAMIPQARHQFENDPDKELIADRAVMKSGAGKIEMMGRDSECHWNAGKLYDQGKIDSIVIGYAHLPGTGWFQHTWGDKGGKIVETTPSGRGITKYLGAKLTDAESAGFADHLRKNAPGQGMIRTKRGGGIKSPQGRGGKGDPNPGHQEKPWSCGPASLVNVCSALGMDVSEKHVRECSDADKDGTDEEQLMTAASELGLSHVASCYASVDAAWQKLVQSVDEGSPCILCVDKWDHWVSVVGVVGDRVVMLDPSNEKDNVAINGVHILTKSQLVQRWKNKDVDRCFYMIAFEKKKKK